jgi:hypothetical protein
MGNADFNDGIILRSTMILRACKMIFEDCSKKKIKKRINDMIIFFYLCAVVILCTYFFTKLSMSNQNTQL